MAVASEVTNVVYPGNNSTTTEYPVTFPVLDGSQIKAGKRLAGQAFVQLASWEFTIIPKAGGAFAITTATAVPSSGSVVIWRELPYTQPVELPLAGRLPSTSVEGGLDRLTFQVQQADEKASRGIRLDRSAAPQSDIIPTANALLGFDAGGNFETLDAARVREMAQMEGDGSNATVTFADAAERAATSATFTGQLGVQRDDGSVWRSTSTTAGGWAATRLAFASVSTEAELLAAVTTARIIRVESLIELTSTFEPAVEGLVFEASGPDAGFLLPHDGATQRTVVRPKAKRITFRGLLFTTNHPKTTGRTWQDIGLRLPTDTTDVSGLVVENCRFMNLAWGILRDGGPTSAAVYDVRVENCLFESIFQGAVYFRWHCHNLRIVGNTFRQRGFTDTHDIENNAIYVANNCNNGIAAFNIITRFGRHAIEIWNSGTDAESVGGCRDWLAAFNTIKEPFPWSTFTPIGITILGSGTSRYIGNVVHDCVISIEVGGDHINQAHQIVTGNHIWNSKNQAISVNGVEYATVYGNHINRVAIDGFPGITNAPIGVEIINGGRNVKVRNNTFKDAGRFNIWVAGKALTITGISQAADAVFSVSAIADATLPNGWFVGKKICLRGIVGPTDLNDRYYEITEVSGNTFKCGVNTSAMPAYVSGGRVQEDWRGLVIADNDFYVFDEIDPTWPGALSIYVYDFQQALIQGNTRFARTTLSGIWGTFLAINYGTVYQDFAGGTVNTTGAGVAIAGSNQSIPCFP